MILRQKSGNSGTDVAGKRIKDDPRVYNLSEEPVMPVANKLLTAEEFAMLPDYEHADLVNGEVILVMPPNPHHGMIAFKVVERLGSWLEQSQAGIAGTDGGFILGRNPDRVRGPDVWFIRSERIPEFSEGFWEVAPDVVIEIISSSDTAEVLKEKLQDYFHAGTKLIWLLYPKFKQVEAHTPDGKMKIFEAEDGLETNIMPGFSCKVAEFFNRPLAKLSDEQ
jgi:Uma2 family endonuclease